MLRRSKFVFPCLFLVLLAGAPRTASSAGLQRIAAPRAEAPVAGVLDINTATPAELKTLPGVGDAYARRIVDGRPYTAKNQLVTRGILPQATYDRIKDQIVAHRVAKP